MVAKYESFISSHYAAIAKAKYGKAGVVGIFELVQRIKEIFLTVITDSYRGQIVIAHAIDGKPLFPRPKVFSSADLLVELSGDILVQPLGGKYLVYRKPRINLKALSMRAIVYVWNSGLEHFILKGVQGEIPKINALDTSFFAIPTFHSLSEALERYGLGSALNCSCPILEESWAEKARLFFKPGPEKIMRTSLHQFLHATMRGAEVRPEQIVDASHPVDIQVAWNLVGSLALIEIKWLGQSRAGRKRRGGHSEGRALVGAKQLAGYIDKNKPFSPYKTARGYLVVIDGRRRGIRPGQRKIRAADGLYHSTREIVYRPQYHITRTDFAPAFRFFVRPEIA
jgi:hypothetical protein